MLMINELLIIKLINALVFSLSCVSPEHRPWGAPGGTDLPVCGHQGRDHHPHQHGGQSRWRPRCHVQGLVRTPFQLDSQPHQLPAAAWHEYLVSSVVVMNICADVWLLLSLLRLLPWVSAMLWWPLWMSVEVDANMQRRISMGERKTSKKRAKKKF